MILRETKTAKVLKVLKIAASDLLRLFNNITCKIIICNPGLLILVNEFEMTCNFNFTSQDTCDEINCC